MTLPHVRTAFLRASALALLAAAGLSCGDGGPPPTHRLVLEERPDELAPGETLYSFVNAFAEGAFAWQSRLEGEVLLHRDCAADPCVWAVVGIAIDGMNAADGRVVSVTSGSATPFAAELDDGGPVGFLVPGGSIRANVRMERDGRAEDARARTPGPSVLVVDPGSWLLELATASGTDRYVLVLYGRLEELSSG